MHTNRTRLVMLVSGAALLAALAVWWSMSRSAGPHTGTSGEPTGSAADDALMKQLQARLGPAPGRPLLPPPGPAAAYPSKEDLHAYWKHVGITRQADDNDAVWALQIAEDHPDREVRFVFVSRLGVLLSVGMSGDALRTTVSDDLRTEVTRVLKAVAGSPAAADRRAALGAIGVGRLWRIPALEQVFIEFAKDTDPQNAKFWRTSYPEYSAWQKKQTNSGG